MAITLDFLGSSQRFVGHLPCTLECDVHFGCAGDEIMGGHRPAKLEATCQPNFDVTLTMCKAFSTVSWKGFPIALDMR